MKTCEVIQVLEGIELPNGSFSETTVSVHLVCSSPEEAERKAKELNRLNRCGAYPSTVGFVMNLHYAVGWKS
jgi:hypothetical protein